MPYVTSQLQQCRNLDTVWYQYIPDCPKVETLSKRGEGVRSRVEPSSAIPGNWQEFLQIDDHKVELFSFVSTSAADLHTDEQVICTHHTEVLCSQPRDVAGCRSARLYLSELRIAFGVGNNFRLLATHEMAKTLGPSRCVGLPMFHAFTAWLIDTMSIMIWRAGARKRLGIHGVSTMMSHLHYVH